MVAMPRSVNHANAFEDCPFVFRVNDNGAGPHLLVQVCTERGWREYRETQASVGPEWNLWWRTNGFPLSQYKQLKNWQFTNHIPKGSSICRKDNLARLLRCMRNVYGPIYDFSPLGYNLPLEYTKLVAECTRQRQNHESAVWICKPVSQSQGRGIFLFRKLSDLCYDSNAVVQRYIQNPLLIGGYKFDLRLYVCIPCYHPLTVYVYREGLARFGTDKFSLSDLDNPFRHLTNSSLNKLGRGYTEKKERVGAGCKWTLRQLRHYLNQAGYTDWLLWQRVAALVVLTVLSNCPVVPSTANCFEFYGFDVLVDSALRPWLLEVNLSPALGNDCDVDVAVKKPMLHDLFDLLGMPVCHTGLSLFTVFSLPASPTPSDDEERRPHSNPALAVVAAAGRWKRRHQQSKDGSVTRPRRKSASRRPRSSRGGAVTPSRPLATSTVVVGSSDCCDRVNRPGCVSGDEHWSCFCYSGQGFRGSARSSVRSSHHLAMWGNGRDWRHPPATEGRWVRLFPFCEASKADGAAPASVGDREVRDVVMAVSRYLRTAKELYRRSPHLSDDDYNSFMRDAMGLTTDVWLPPSK